MIKAKLLAVFSAIVAVLAVSAAPAFAEFESTTTHGAFKTGAALLTGGGGTLSCTSTSGEWKIEPPVKSKNRKKKVNKFLLSRSASEPDDQHVERM